jgi:peptide/nickel transport system permease protein
MTHDVAQIQMERPHHSNRFLTALIQHRLAVVGVIVLLLFVFMALFAEGITTYAYDERDSANRDSAPTLEHPLGTDALGFDVWSQLVYSTRVSLLVGITTGVLVVGLGTLIGLVAGYFGGWVDQVLMRLADTVISFPGLVIILAAIAVLGSSLTNIVLVMGVILWPGTARLVRSQVLSLRNWDFVEAARAQGATKRRILWRHILPNVLSSVIVAVTLAVASAILIEANLSFLGLGDPTQPSWGRMLNAAQSHRVLRTRWWLWAPPGIAIALCTLSINFIGDGLRDALDPYTVT